MERLRPSFRLNERYRLSHRIAAGGMGEVWEAQDEVLERPVAVKVLHPHTMAEKAMSARFHDEAKLAAQLQSVHVVDVYDYGEHDGLAYLVMELLPGRTVAGEIAAHGPLEPEQVAHILADTADALAVAHEAGVVHRDVKPSNILLTEAGDAKLADFGIARAIDGASHTLTGEMVGTPQYLSPEQARGETATSASDIYCLGIVAHEMLSGRRPFDKPTPIATALAQVQEPPPPLPGTVPSPLASLVMACLEKEAAQRPESGPQFVEQLRTIERDFVAAGAVADVAVAVAAEVPPVPARGQVAPRVLAAVSLAAIVVLIFLAMMLW